LISTFFHELGIVQQGSVHGVKIHAADMHPHELTLLRIVRIREGCFDGELIAILGLAEGADEVRETLFRFGDGRGHARIILVDLYDRFLGGLQFFSGRRARRASCGTDNTFWFR
jgi:hypothetical protein